MMEFLPFSTLMEFRIDLEATRLNKIKTNDMTGSALQSLKMRKIFRFFFVQSQARKGLTSALTMLKFNE